MRVELAFVASAGIVRDTAWRTEVLAISRHQVPYPCQSSCPCQASLGERVIGGDDVNVGSGEMTSDELVDDDGPQEEEEVIVASCPGHRL